MRYYCIVIGEGTASASPSSVSGLAQGFSDLGDLVAPQRGKRIPIRKRRSSRKVSNSVGGHVFVSVLDDTGPQSQTFNQLVATNLTALGQPLGLPSTLKAIPGAPIAGAQFTSVVNNQNDPGALDIEFDITASPNGHLLSGWLKIYGIEQGIISQATQLNRREIQIYAGFVEGLPLANLQTSHKGLIADGMILPCYGNWIGNELSIEFIINPGKGGPGGPTDQKNIIHNMPQGSPLGSAIYQALTTAFPDYSINVNISDSLVLPAPDQGYYQSIEQYQNYVKSLSHKILGTPDTTGYQGVSMYSQGNKINITDGTRIGNTIDIQYADLVGQPTWSPQGNNTLQIKTVLRADIAPAGEGGNIQVTLPPNLLISTPRAASSMFIAGQLLQYQPGDVLNFQGSWIVISVRHVGKFRQPTGESWVTIIDAVAPFSTNLGTANVDSTGGIHSFTPNVVSSGGAYSP